MPPDLRIAFPEPGRDNTPPRPGVIRLIATEPGAYILEIWNEVQWAMIPPEKRPDDAKGIVGTGVHWRVGFILHAADRPTVVSLPSRRKPRRPHPVS